MCATWVQYKNNTKHNDWDNLIGLKYGNIVNLILENEYLDID